MPLVGAPTFDWIINPNTIFGFLIEIEDLFKDYDTTSSKLAQFIKFKLVRSAKKYSQWIQDNED